jgi:cellulose synthase operon protein C
MFKVECPGCKAPYQVDERRIPSSGLKMRCPKCGTSFKVDQPSDARRTGPNPVFGGVLGVGESAPPPAVAPPPDPNKGTMLGVAPARSAALKGTMLGVAPAAAAGLPASLPKAAAPPPAAPALAASPPAASPPARPPVPGRPPIPRPGAAPAPSADLPAVAARSAAGGIDLPSVAASTSNAPKASPGPAAPSSARALELDLPAVGRAKSADLPSPRAGAPGRQAPSPASLPAEPFDIELDLPAVGGKGSEVAGLPAPAPQRGGIDLPSVSRSQASLPAVAGGSLPSPASGVGLPARPSVPRQPSGAIGIELPSPRGHVDLPSPSGRLGLLDVDLPLSAPDLPTPIELASDLPSLSGGNLPALAGDLPSLGGDLPSLGGNLPSPGGNLPALSGNLPSRSSAGLPARSTAGLPAPSSAQRSTSPSIPPALGGAFPGGRAVSTPGMRSPSLGPSDSPPPAFAEIELPPSESLPPPPQSFGGSFGEVDLLGSIPARAAASSADLEADPFGEASLPGPASSASVPPGHAYPEPAATALQRQTGGGGTDYGEVSLDGGGSIGGEVALDAPLPAPPARTDDDMEFGAVPQEAPPGTVTQAKMSRPPPSKAPPAKPKSRLGLQLLVGAFVLGLGGASLALVPAVGPFGAFFVMDHLKAGEYHALVQATAKSANAALAQDTYPNAARAQALVAAAQANARRAKGLSALAAYVGFTSELRFGLDAASHARGSVLLGELADETDVELLELARAAQAAADGQIAKARQLLSAAEARGKSAESALLRAELELRAKDAKGALAAWQAAAGYGDTPRLQYGLARAKYAAGDDLGALGQAQAVLQKYPQHVGARVLMARLSSGSRENEARALSLLEDVVKDARSASPDELVQAYTLLGSLHLGRSRISAAERAFGEALKINPKAARALVGLGDSLYRAGRYSEAEARFKAATEADPDDLLAKVGVAKSKLALERVQDAGALLKKLRETNPGSPVVAYWFGRVQEALGAREQAQAAYREVLKVAPAEPASADVYIALAMLQNQEGRAEDAQKTLDSAKQLMPNVPGVWRALGDVAQSQGRYKEALAHFRRAATLDPDDLGAKFRIGGALRRDGQFEEASKAFDAVAAVDQDYPGLALERGLLYEASGRSEEALKQYEIALAKAPNDPDLMLRVGCGKVAANRAEQAEELLRKVLSQRPSSAETHHCLGRALLVQGTRLADALRMLERAVELDSNRAEYFLYVGWAANEAGNVPKAEKSLAEALRLDQGLADAYWQRGVLRQRQGAVRDAIADLSKALALRPSRHEAHAALADAYYDLGREVEAMKEWQLAIQAQPDNATWRFRYGKLLSANRQNEAAVEQLSRALALVENVDPPPRWRWEAHHALARSLGASPEAAKHWEQFLRLGPRDSPYRAEAKAYLEKIGRPWTLD